MSKDQDIASMYNMCVYIHTFVGVYIYTYSLIFDILYLYYIYKIIHKLCLRQKEKAPSALTKATQEQKSQQLELPCPQKSIFVI